MPRAKSAEAVQNRYWEATRNREVNSEVAKALGRLDNLFVKLYQSGATNRYVSTVSDEMADLDIYTDTMEEYLGTEEEQNVVDTVNTSLSKLHSNLMEALNSESPEAGKSCYQWLIDEAKKDGQDFVADMKTLDSITGLGWELEQPQAERESQEKAEPAPEQEAEPTLSDEAVSKLGAEDVARELYSELGKLGGKLDNAYGGSWLDETENTQYAFDDFLTKEDPKLLKDAIKKAEDFLNRDLGDGKTVGDFGRENNALGANYEKLMNRAKEIAEIEIKEQEKAAQEKVEEPKVEEPVEEQAEEQPKVEEQPKPFDSMAEIAAQQRYWAEELKKQLISETTTYHQILRPLCQLRALQEMKESGYVGESENDISWRAQTQSMAEEHKSANVRLTLRNTKSQLMRMFGKTENGVYQLHSPEQLVRAFADGVEQTEKNSERWGQMASLSNTALNSEGEERRTAVATLVAMQRIYYGEKDANKTNTSLKKISDEQRVENLAKFMLKDKAFQEIADSDQLDAYLRGRDFETLADQVQRFRKERSKEAAQEKAEPAPEQKAEPAPEQKAEPTLSDEAVSKLGVKDVAGELYNELGKLGGELYKAYNGKWLNETEDTQYAFDDVMTKKDPKLLEDAIKKAEDFLNSDLGDGKTIADFAKEKKLLGGNFDKLMKRAGEIANPERQAEQPQAEKKVEERAEEQPELEAEEQPELEAEEQPELEAEEKTAASWIEEQKADLANRIRGNQRGDNYPAADIARIMAARELSNSVRGKKSTLGELMNEQKISERAAKIMENKSFKDFAAKLSKGENLSKVEAIFKKTHSHGGELDDMFRDYLTKRPAGELENDPDLKRWMPTVKKRVEFLQSEAAKVQKKNETPYKEAAEILLLRQAAEVKRGGKGLEANVPVIGEKGASSLQASVKNYTNDAKFKEAFDQPDVKKYILSGHGGEMAERYNKQPEAKKIEQKQQNGQEKGV